ncbi:MAG: S1/P1 nuclease [Nitrospinales bacterium]
MAWGPKGHIIVGEIAQMNLLPEVEEKIRKNFNIKKLARVSNWADKVKTKRNQKTWHYTNIAPNSSVYEPERDCPDGRCVTEKILEFANVLKEPGSTQSRKEALKDLVHFVGDIHQPLHLGNKKDRGGNKIASLYHGEETNLHALWDGEMIFGEKKNLLEYARSLNADLCQPDDSPWSRASIKVWADESRKLALDKAYSFRATKNREWPPQYIAIARITMERQMCLAGIRLANLLNTVLK